LPDAQQAIKLAAEAKPGYRRLQIGSELFTSAGPEIVDEFGQWRVGFSGPEISRYSNTVAKAVAAATRLDRQMLPFTPRVALK